MTQPSQFCVPTRVDSFLQEQASVVQTAASSEFVGWGARHALEVLLRPTDTSNLSSCLE